jgi:hypothetical protein
MSNCVYCGVTENLNTAFHITLDDGEKVKVEICDTHADDATVKTAKVAFLDKKKQIDAFLEQAKALGLNISINNNSKLSVVTDNTAANPLPSSQQYHNRHDFRSDFLEGDDVVETDMLDRQALKSVGGSTDFGMVSSYSSISMNSLTDKLDSDVLKGKARMVMVEGREGVPIAIPGQRVDGTGTTRIRINKKEDDLKLQARFKRMAEDSIAGKVNFARDGYQGATSTCSFCKGECFIRNGVETITCPKCNGSGIISTY